MGWKIQRNEISVGVRMSEKICLVDFYSNGVNLQKKPYVYCEMTINRSIYRKNKYFEKC